jgi:hypothetical protein
VNAYTANGPTFPLTTNLDATAVQANTSFVFYGKSHPSYGERLQENILHLLENFSGSIEPKNAISGQLWFKRLDHIKTAGGWFAWDDASSTWKVIAVMVGTPTTLVHGEFWNNGNVLTRTVNVPNHPLSPSLVNISYDLRMTVNDPNAAGLLPNKELNVFDGKEWKPVNRVVNGKITPSTGTKGSLWFDENANMMKVFNGTDYEAIGGDYLKSIGGTLTGNLNMDNHDIIGLSANPVATGATSKEYVDGALAATTATLTGLITAAGALPTDFTTPASAELNYLKFDPIDGKYKPSKVSAKFADLTDILTSNISLDNIKTLENITTPLTGLFDGKLNTSGGVMSGDIDMGDFKLRNVLSPVQPKDAANKQYIDDKKTEILNTVTQYVLDVSFSEFDSKISVAKGDNTSTSFEVAKKDHIHEPTVATRTVITTGPDANTANGIVPFKVTKNSLTVFKNGLKLIEDEFAHVTLATSQPVSKDTDTGLTSGTTYNFTVDGTAHSITPSFTTGHYSYSNLVNALSGILSGYGIELTPSGLIITASVAAHALDITDGDLFSSINGAAVIVAGPWNTPSTGLAHDFAPVGEFNSISTSITLHANVDWATTTLEIIQG